MESRSSYYSDRPKSGMVIETMAAPNPACPNIKGMCCLMLLLNIGIILVTLGFTIVIQFAHLHFIWFMGLLFVVFGFITLIATLIYAVVLYRDMKERERDLYWAHHWQKNITLE